MQVNKLRYVIEQVIGARRHRRVPAVAGDQPLQPRDLLRLLRDLRLQLRVLRPQPRVRLQQRGNHIRRIRRIAHTATTSQRRYTTSLSDQIDTTSRAGAALNPRPATGRDTAKS